MLALKMNFKRMSNHPIQLVFTLIQLAIGVGLVIVILSFIYNIWDAGNSDKKTVYQTRFLQSRIVKKVFTKDMIEQLENIEEITGVAIIETAFNGFLESDGVTYVYNEITGTDENIFSILDLTLLEGNFFTESDVNNATHLVVISERVNSLLFGTESGVGKKFTIRNQRGAEKQLEVVGVFDEEQFSLDPGNEVDFIVPYTIFNRYSTVYSRIWIGSSNLTYHIVADEINMILADLVNLSNTELRIDNLKERDQSISKSYIKGFTSFVSPYAMIATIATFVGLLSLILTNVLGRRREIGQLRAMGGTKWSIINLVILESVSISILGGLLGVILASLTVQPIIENIFLQRFSIGNFLTITTGLSWQAVFVTLIGTLVVGVLAGLYPAIQAVSVTPIEAIRE